jgi:hypothetical protein
MLRQNSRAMRGENAEVCFHLRRPCEPAGTHRARTLVFSEVADAFLSNQGQGLWVPAFAGTTESLPIDSPINSYKI